MTKSRKDLTTAEAMFKRALKVNPNDANNLGRYAVFLSDQRKDYDAAEAMFKRALKVNPNDANNLGRYAVFLSVQRKDYDDAEAMYKRAVDTDPNDANNLSNYAGFLFGLGLFPKGVEYLRRAELVEEKPLALEAELLFYRVAHDPDSWPKVLAKLRKVVEAGARSPGWSFEANIARAEKNGHPNIALLRTLAKVVTEAADPSLLSGFAEWKDADNSSPLTP
jgi:tetratricopeptide (TPR) repeat protein